MIENVDIALNSHITRKSQQIHVCTTPINTPFYPCQDPPHADPGLRNAVYTKSLWSRPIAGVGTRWTIMQCIHFNKLRAFVPQPGSRNPHFTPIVAPFCGRVRFSCTVGKCVHNSPIRHVQRTYERIYAYPYNVRIRT